MKKSLLLLSGVAILTGIFAPEVAAAAPKYGPQERPWAVPLWKEHGWLHSEAGKGSDFWLLIGYYFPQPNDYTCSAAALAPVLNAALNSQPRTDDDPILKPETIVAAVDVEHWPARLSEKGYAKEGAPKPVHGVEFDMFPRIIGAAFRHYGLKTVRTELVRMEDAGGKALERLVRDLEANEGNPRNFIIADLDQGKLNGEPEAGHWVAVGAYDREKRRVLVLDPDRDSYEPYWVAVEHFAAAMATVDKSAKLHRGYILVSY